MTLSHPRLQHRHFYFLQEPYHTRLPDLLLPTGNRVNMAHLTLLVQIYMGRFLQHEQLRPLHLRVLTRR